MADDVMDSIASEIKEYLKLLPDWIHTRIDKWREEFSGNIMICISFKCVTVFHHIHEVSVLRNRPDLTFEIGYSITPIELNQGHQIVQHVIRSILTLARPYFYEQDPLLGQEIPYPQNHLTINPQDSKIRFAFEPPNLKRPKWAGAAGLNTQECTLCHRDFTDYAMWGGGNLQWVHKDCWIDLSPPPYAD